MNPLTRKAQGTLEVMVIVATSALAILWIAPYAIRSINAYFQTTESAMKDSAQEELLEAPTINIETTCQSSSACGGTDEGKNCLTSNGDDCGVGYRCYFETCNVGQASEYQKNHCDPDPSCNVPSIGDCGGSGTDETGKVIQCDERVAIINIITALGTVSHCAAPGEKVNGIVANDKCKDFCVSRSAKSKDWCPGSPKATKESQAVSYVAEAENCSICPDQCCAYCKSPFIPTGGQPGQPGTDCGCPSNMTEVNGKCEKMCPPIQVPGLMPGYQCKYGYNFCGYVTLSKTLTLSRKKISQPCPNCDAYNSWCCGTVSATCIDGKWTKIDDDCTYDWGGYGTSYIPLPICGVDIKYL